MDPWRMKVPDVRITEGPSDFRIYQQTEKGKADICLAGTWDEVPDGRDVRISIRILREIDFAPIPPTTDWTAVEKMARGTWSHTLRGVPCGGLYAIQTRLEWVGPDDLPAGRLGDSVHHVGVGDLWITAGQSNASGTGRGVAEDGPELGVHILGNDERWAPAVHPLNAPRGTDHPNRDAGAGTSPYLRFAKTLRRELGRPIGLVQTAKGGSALREWHVEEEPDAPLWHNLVHCVGLAGGSVRGMVWYQGCSDGGLSTEPDAWSYEPRWAAFLDRAREQFGTLPVVVTQLNRWTDVEHPPEVVEGFSIVREAQRRAGKLPGVCVIPSLDISLSDGIHNSSAGNVVLGERAARAALGFVYGREIPWRAPEPRRAIGENGGRTIRIEFDGVTSRLILLGRGLEDFRVRDEAGTAQIASATAEGDTVQLDLSRAIEGRATVDGAYGVNPEWTLRDYETNMPALAFHAFPVA